MLALQDAIYQMACSVLYISWNCSILILFWVCKQTLTINVLVLYFSDSEYHVTFANYHDKTMEFGQNYDGVPD